MLAPTGNPAFPIARSVVTSSGGVPPALAALPAGALIVGKVSGHDPAGRVLVRTDAGTLALASHLDLRRGNTVTLRVRGTPARGDPVAGGPAFAATVELVDGQPPKPAPRPVGVETAPVRAPTGNAPIAPARPVVTSSGTVPRALAALPEGVPIIGTVTGHDPAGRVLVRTESGTLALSSDLELSRGNTVTLRVRGTPVRGGPAFAATVEAVDGKPPHAARPDAGREAGAVRAPTGIAPVRAIVTSSGTVPPVLAALPAGTSIVATVTGRDPAGGVVLRTEAGTLTLATQLDLRRGNTVTLRVRAGPAFAATVEAVDGKRPQAARPDAGREAGAVRTLTGIAPVRAIVTSSGVVPPALAALPAGTAIVGTVVGHDPAGGVLVRTEAGTLTLAGTLAGELDLRRGNTVTLRVRGGPVFVATVEAIDGRPPQAAAPRAAGRETSPAPAPPGAPPPGAPPPGAPTPSTPAPIAPGPIAPAPIAPAPIAPATASAQVVVSSPGQVPPTVAATVELVDARPPDAGRPAPSNAARPLREPTGTAPPAGSAIVGAVTGHDTEGRVLVRAEAGTFALASKLELRPGDTVTLRVTGGPLFAATVETIDGRPPQPDRPAAGRYSAAAPVVVAAPGEVPPALAALPAGAPIVGAVAGHDPAGHVLVGTDAGTLALATRLDLTQGSTVTLRVRGAPVFAAAIEAVDGRPPEAALAAPPPLLPPAPELRPQAPLDLARGWPALGDAIATLRHVDPKLGQATLDRAIPQAGANLAQMALTFIAALRAGDLAGWMGRAAVGALEDGGHGALVHRLTGDFGQIAGLVDRPAPGEWQPFLVPLFDGAWLRQLRLFVRRRGGDADNEHGEMRFVVEVELDRFGEIQLDGFLREHRLDLILRSQTPLADAERHDVTAIFSQGLALGGLTGALGFQVTREFPVAPLEALAAGDASAHGGVMA